MRPAPRRVPSSAKWKKRFAIASRWLHLYLSMLSFGVILFFSATGLTLNHADRFTSREKVTRLSGIIAANIMQASSGPDKLAIVEQLRHDHGVRGEVTDFRNEEDQTGVSFKGAGYTADAFIERPSGKYELIETRSGAIAVINDLHRGAVTGKAWSWVIDASAILLSLASLTGLLLLFFVYKRRVSGLFVTAAGIAVVLLIYKLMVP